MLGVGRCWAAQRSFIDETCSPEDPARCDCAIAMVATNSIGVLFFTISCVRALFILFSSRRKRVMPRKDLADSMRALNNNTLPSTKEES